MWIKNIDTVKLKISHRKKLLEVFDMKSIIVIKNLKKYFGEIKAVDDISFNVKEGEFFAFLGINGAGKSTTINIMCGDYSKDAGEIVIDGLNVDSDIEAIKPRLGVVYQESVLDKQLSVKENLEYKACLYGIKGEQFREQLEKIDELLKIKELLKRPVGKLSGFFPSTASSFKPTSQQPVLIRKPEVLFGRRLIV